MRVLCGTPFVDTRAADLTWTLDHRPLTPLASRRVVVGAVEVELRVLGASHQVLLRDARGRRLIETVACLPDSDGLLPTRARPPVPGLADYDFASEVEILDPDTFAARVDRIRADADSGEGLVAVFPGSPHAVTALSLLRTGRFGLAWRTWHAYPQSGELVTTRTSVTWTPPAEAATTHGGGARSATSAPVPALTSTPASGRSGRTGKEAG